ncbi:MAG: hypothetical protein ACE3L7_05430 [Candidatus Pristimantibacillus sp.]
MKRILPFVLLLGIIVSISAFSPNKAYACSCAEPGTKKNFEQSSVVFTGTLESKDSEGGNVFSIDKVWKGELADGHGSRQGYSNTKQLD